MVDSTLTDLSIVWAAVERARGRLDDDLVWALLLVAADRARRRAQHERGRAAAGGRVVGTLRLNGAVSLRLVLASPDGQPADVTRATSGTREWAREPGETAAAFVARVAAEAPRPVLVIAWDEHARAFSALREPDGGPTPRVAQGRATHMAGGAAARRRGPQAARRYRKLPDGAVRSVRL